MVFGYTRFYLIIGQTSLDFEVRPALGGHTGALGFRAVDVLENSIAHAGAPGVYVFNGATDELLTYPIDFAWQSLIDQTAATVLSKLALAYHKLTKELRVAAPYLYPSGTSGEWIMDMNRSRADPNESAQAWFSTDRPIGGYVQWDGNEATTGNQGRIFSWAITAAKLFEERTGTSADGSDLSMEYDGPALPFGLQFTRVIDSYLEVQPAAGTLTVELIVDGLSLGVQTITIGGNLPRYGVAHYGVDNYGGFSRTTVPVVWPLEADGHTAQLLMRYLGQGDFHAYTYGHNILPEPLPRGF